MSLINKMLLDLDKRRSDSLAGSAIQGQIRPAPQHTGIQRAWWVGIALGLALLLAAGAAWLVLRPSAPQIATVTPAPQLPTATAARAPTPEASAVLQAEPQALFEYQLKLDNQLTLDSLLKDTARATAASDSAPPALASVKPAPPSAKASAERSAASRLAPNTSDAATSIHKQVKELTLQQRAENDYRKAVTQMRQGKVTEAIAGLEQALQLDARHGAARQTLVALLLESKRQDEAMLKLREGLNLDPSQAGLAMILARLQVDGDKGETRPALETLQRTLPYAVERADYQAFVAALLQREGRHKEAIEHYGLALRKTPQNGVWWMGLGISLQAENRLPEALDAYGRARASNTLSAVLLAFVEQKLGQVRQ